MTDKLTRILYVEDEPDIAAIAVMALEEIGGFDVRYCASSDDCLLQFQKYDPQLLLIDVMMPGRDGPTTLSLVQQTEKGRNCPAIFITAKVQFHEQEAYKKMGALGVIAKPFDPLTLSQTIESLWNKNEEKRIKTLF